ncbi:MAG: dephospho-CoA kinase [Erysipelotrichaceae bacterium]|nr:dephospho-CoA kinase [Erysipelotrichaceae bacterium]
MSSVSEKKVIGITGTMGAGKSTVSAILAEKMPVADCDKINAELLVPGREGYAALKEKGLLIADPQGMVDKKETARKIFSDPSFKKKYESVLHPLIVKKMDEWIEEQTGWCAMEVPLLFELGLQDKFDEIWCVSCKDETAVERLIKYRGFSCEEAAARIKNQLNREQKEKNSSHVLMNDATRQDLEKQIAKLLSER